MAGDWIKMRCNLWDDPRVSRIVDLTESSEAVVVGALYWLWASADQHSEDGMMPGLTLRSIDRKTGIQGFGAALVSINWLQDREEGVLIARFEEHNGKSAKRRCSESVRKMSARDADKLQQSSAHREDREKDREKTGLSDSPSDNSNVGGASPSAQPKKSNRGTRLPEDWKLPVDWGEWAMEEVPGLTRADVKKEAAKFRDHWHSKPGKDGVKLEWEATWRNWMRSDLIKPSGKAPAAQSDTWFMNSTGITEKGAERGIVQGEGELFPYFKDRVYAEFGITEEMVRKARVDQNG